VLSYEKKRTSTYENGVVILVREQGFTDLGVTRVAKGGNSVQIEEEANQGQKIVTPLRNATCQAHSEKVRLQVEGRSQFQRCVGSCEAVKGKKRLTFTRKERGEKGLERAKRKIF